MTEAEALQFFIERKTAYLSTFSGPAGKAVLDDLKVFCRGRETCVVIGDRDRTYVLEGRREVLLRIQDYLELSPEDLTALNTKPAKER